MLVLRPSQRIIPVQHDRIGTELLKARDKIIPYSSPLIRLGNGMVLP